MATTYITLALIISIAFGMWLALFDADFITFGYDLHRTYLGNSRISNKSIWIVGASSGIGEFLVYELVESGCKKLILSSRREEQLKRVKNNALLISNDIQIIIKPLDLFHFATKDNYNDDFINSLMDEIPFNTVDILVLNSGMVQFGYAIDNNIKVLQHILQINTVAPIALIQSIIRYWQNNNDASNNYKYQIALTSSIAGKLGSPRQSAYSMSKFGVNGYLETLRMELIDDDIDINIINPGHIQLSQHSLKAKSSSLDENNEIKRGKDSGDKGRMTLKRCAHLYVTMLEYSITESIVSIHPILLFTYIKQYFPIFYHPLTKHLLPLVEKDYKKPKKI